jgi:hypothetical protein
VQFSSKDQEHGERMEFIARCAAGLEPNINGDDFVGTYKGTMNSFNRDWNIVTWHERPDSEKEGYLSSLVNLIDGLTAEIESTTNMEKKKKLRSQREAIEWVHCAIRALGVGDGRLVRDITVAMIGDVPPTWALALM